MNVDAEYRCDGPYFNALCRLVDPLIRDWKWNGACDALH